jgi:HEAT repeat protein
MGSLNSRVRICAIALGVGALIAFVNSSWLRGDDAAIIPVGPSAPLAARAVASVSPQLSSQFPSPSQRDSTEQPETPARELSPDTVDRLVRDAVADDAGTRAEAIDALAAAPEATAVPVLQKIMGSGGDIERQLALSSLHVLALRHGDTSGAIRELLRQAAYDGGDEAVASGAQAILDDIERGGEWHAALTDAPDGAR